MTAEIAIMNKSAVALAADSAITHRLNNRSKIYNSANKLFALSKYRPIAIMFYGRADFLGIPWETVIKLYRENLGTKSFKSLEDYTENFKEYLRNEVLFRNEPEREITVTNLARIIIYKIKHYLDDSLQSKTLGASLDQVALDIKETPRLNSPSISETQTLDTVKRYLGNVPLQRLFDSVDPKIVIRGKEDVIRALIVQLTVTQFFTLIGMSGIVIAGYGENEFFPSLNCFSVEGLIGDTIRIGNSDSTKISHEVSVRICPFAQTDTINGFMKGVDPSLSDVMAAYLKGSVEYLLQLVNGFLEKHSEIVDDNIIKSLKEFSAKEGPNYLKEKMDEYQVTNFLTPLLQSTASLPKEELATMAESLVNLASLKQRITMDMETVGGPIDVAVISKGDGLIWIKRKHYFEPELNIGFLANYFPNSASKHKGNRK